MTDLETRLAATMRAHDAAAPTGAEIEVLLAGSTTRPRRVAAGLLAVAVAVCLVIVVAGVTTYAATRRTPSAPTVGPSPVQLPRTHGEAITRALVSADGRTITVPATGGGCVVGVHLSATQTPTTVGLDLSQHVSKGGICTDEIRSLQASTVLAQPLGTRTLVDQSSGRDISYIPGQDLAVPGWLPSRASSPRNTYMNGWTRTYSFPEGTRTAPLQITENPGHFANPDQFTANRASATTMSVNGTPAQLVVERATSGRVEEAFVGWMAGRYSIIVSSMPWVAGQRALSPQTVMRVARALKVPEAAH